MATPSIARIKLAVAEEYGVTVREMESDRRSHVIVRPRQAAMWLCRQLTGRSLPEIGRYFGGRDHTTVMHACRVVERRLDDPDEREILTRLADRLSEGEDVWTNGNARADWALQQVGEIQHEIERLQDRLARFALVLAQSTGKRSRIVVPALPAAPAPPNSRPEETPATPAAAPSRLRGTCHTPDCSGTRQPGRDHCAACITGKARAA